MEAYFAHIAVMLFDVKNGNPNEDPNRGNMPRFDSETGYRIYVKDGVPLNCSDVKACEEENSVPAGVTCVRMG